MHIVAQPDCTDGKAFMEYGNNCGKICGQTSDTGCEEEREVDGCFCPPGKYLHDYQCIDAANCPCSRGDLYYNPGEIIELNCQK